MMEKCADAPQIEKKSELLELEDNIGRLREDSVDLKVRANDLLCVLLDAGTEPSGENKDSVRPRGKNRFCEASEVVQEIKENLLRTRDILGEITCMVNK